ncbi:MAG: hypothetical protein Fur0027_14440 [Raineya sp.]
MKLLQKIQSLFAYKASTEVQLAEALARLSVRKTLESKQNYYKARVFQADKHIRDWKNAIDEALAPPYYRKQALFEVIEQTKYDAQVQAQMQTRKNGTLAERFLLEASPSVQRLVKQIIGVVLDSLFYWASACEIEGEQLYILSAEHLCPEKKQISIGYEKGIPFEAFESLLVFENPYKHLGLLAFASQYAIYKRFSLSDWSRHSELFGMPFLSLRTPVTDTEEIKKRHHALANFGSNAYVILDTDETLEAIDTKATTSPYEMYLQMIKFCDEQISKIIVGQIATADQKAFVGSAEVQERILDWYIEHDMLYVEEVMNTQVLPLLARKGLVSPDAAFVWEHFAKKQETRGRKQDERQENLNLHTCQHEHQDYESYLISLKKKALFEANTRTQNGVSRFDFDFDSFWERQDDSLFNYYLNEFQKPIKDLLSETDYPELQAKFTQNAYEFALAKASTFFERSKGLSQKDAEAVFLKMEKHNETEKIQFALAIQAGEEWERLLQDEDIFPNLEYRAVMDENTRESHAILNGIIRPLRDSFWQKYFPPIDYRCRCTIRQHDKEAKITAKLPENLPKISKGLKHNPGVSGKAFDYEHPYFENISKSVLTKETRKHSTEKAKKKLLGKTIENKFEIEFTTKGIKEAINQPFYEYNLKNILVGEFLEQTLKQAVYIGKELPKNKKQHLKFIHFYKVVFLENAYLLVSETTDRKFVFFGITDIAPTKLIK